METVVVDDGGDAGGKWTYWLWCLVMVMGVGVVKVE